MAEVVGNKNNSEVDNNKNNSKMTDVGDNYNGIEIVE